MLTLRWGINPNIIKSYKNYLQNTQHMVLRNRPTLLIGTERFACLNSPLACSWGPLPSTRQVPGSSPGPGGRAACAFFLHPPFLPPSGDSFFSHLPHQPRKSVRVIKYLSNPHTHTHVCFLAFGCSLVQYLTWDTLESWNSSGTLIPNLLLDKDHSLHIVALDKSTELSTYRERERKKKKNMSRLIFNLQ